MRFPTDTETRIAFAQAADVARELGHRELGPDHLVLAMLTNVRGRAFAALSARGITYAEARDRVAAHHAARADQGPAESSYDAERRALSRLGLDLEKVREAVQETYGEDITEGWGERRRRPGRGPRAEAELDGGPEAGGGRGRRGPRSERFGPFGLPVSEELRAIFAELRREAWDERRAAFEDRTEDRPDGPRRGRGRRGHRHGHVGPREPRGTERLFAAVLTADSAAVRAALGGLPNADRAQVAADLRSEATTA